MILEFDMPNGRMAVDLMVYATEAGIRRAYIEMALEKARRRKTCQR